MTVNHWQVFENPVSAWQIELPKNLTVDQTLEFVSAVINAGRAQDVYRLFLGAFGEQESREQEFDWSSYLADHVSKSKWLQLFPGAGMFNLSDIQPLQQGAPIVIPKSRLAFYAADGRIKESMVDNISDLGVRLGLRSADDKPYWASALSIDALSVSGDHGYSDIITIDLYSDIWMPRVNRELTEEEELYDDGTNPEQFVVSNHELARQHTTRLNTFLDTVRAHVIILGGTMALDPDCWPYLGIATNVGIPLDG